MAVINKNLRCLCFFLQGKVFCQKRSSIDLLCRVYVSRVSLREFLKVKNCLNLQILDLVRAEGCSFAFPTVTVDMPENA